MKTMQVEVKQYQRKRADELIIAWAKFNFKSVVGLVSSKHGDGKSLYIYEIKIPHTP